MESYYDIPALTEDQRLRDSVRLIRQYSLLPFMTTRQFFYPRVVLEFYHTMTSQGVPSPLEIRFSIDGRTRVLRAKEYYSCIGPASSPGEFHRLSAVASAVTERDGSISG